MAKDFLGRELKIGDKVIFCQLNYRQFIIDYITKLTDKTATLKHERTNVGSTKTIQFHKQLILITD